MNKIIFISTLILTLNTQAQNTLGKTDDIARIVLSSYIPSQIANLPQEASNLLLTKLDKIATQKGMGGGRNSSRFIITANIVVIDKEITPTAPPQHMYNLEVSFYIGDAVDGIKFSTISNNYLGIAPSETKAYIAALNQIKPTDKIFNQFLEDGKNKIIEYYNSKCDFYLKEAQTLTSKGQYDGAIATLVSIPEVCKECYEKAMDAVGPIYKQQIERQCKKDLMEANRLWSTNQDYYGAEQASKSLANIDPNSSCYNEAKLLNDKIATRIKEIDQREWSFQLKQQQDDVDLQKAEIKSARDIGVAYGSNQPKTITTYNVQGWW